MELVEEDEANEKKKTEIGKTKEKRRRGRPKKTDTPELVEQFEEDKKTEGKIIKEIKRRGRPKKTSLGIQNIRLST